MSSSLPEGISVRPATREDAPAVVAVLRAEEETFAGESRVGVADLLDWWARTDLAHDSWLVERAGNVLGCWWLEPGDDYGTGYGSVHPEARGLALEAALLDRSEARTRELGLSSVQRNAVLAANTELCTVLEGRGYREVRRFFVMALDLSKESPPAELPAGYAIETFEEADARAWHAAAKEAFADEWGFQGLPFDEWWQFRSQAPDFDPTLWFLIRDGHEIAALARCDAGRREGGFIGMLGVRKPWRRRGFGLALLAHAFREFRNRGFDRVSLGVDSENPTGATRLYERAGMHVELEYVTFERALA
jgi:mycothiol synthase